MKVFKLIIIVKGSNWNSAYYSSRESAYKALCKEIKRVLNLLKNNREKIKTKILHYSENISLFCQFGDSSFGIAEIDIPENEIKKNPLKDKKYGIVVKDNSEKWKNKLLALDRNLADYGGGSLDSSCINRKWDGEIESLTESEAKEIYLQNVS